MLVKGASDYLLCTPVDFPNKFEAYFLWYTSYVYSFSGKWATYVCITKSQIIGYIGNIAYYG